MGELKLWSPPDSSDGNKVYLTFDEMEERYGLFIAQVCSTITRGKKPYGKKICRMMYAIYRGDIDRIDTEEEAEAFFASIGKKEITQEDVENAKKRAVASYKGQETKKRNKEARSMPRPGSPAERAYRALEEEQRENARWLHTNETEPIEIKRVLNNIDPFVACQNRINNTTAVDNRLVGGEYVMSSLKSPLMVLLYLLQHRPFISKDKKIYNKEYETIYKDGYIGVDKSVAEIADDLNLSYKTAYNYIKRLMDEKIIIDKRRGRKHYFILGYISNDEEIYFYNLPKWKRNLPD